MGAPCLLAPSSALWALLGRVLGTCLGLGEAALEQGHPLSLSLGILVPVCQFVCLSFPARHVHRENSPQPTIPELCERLGEWGGLFV